MKRTTAIAFGVLILGALLILFAVLFGPYSERGEGCLFCGRTRTTVERFGIVIRQRIETNAGSDWVDSLYPDHRKHAYELSWVTTRSRFFGDAESGDAVGSLVPQIEMLRRRESEEVALETLERYHELIALPEQQRYDAMPGFIKELRNLFDQ